MNEVSTLTNDINRIEIEIDFYKQQAGQSIWEIGRRLNHVKENDLSHGEFSAWLEKIRINHPEANRMMKVANELPYSSTLKNLGSTALYLIATLPEEEREKEHDLPSGETKTVDEMTVRELQEVKRKNRELEQLLEQEKNKPPKEKEHPHVDDLRSDNEQLSQALRDAQKEANDLKKQADAATKRSDFLELQIDELYAERKEVDEKSQRFDELTEGIRKLEGQYSNNQKMLVSHKRVMDTIRTGNELLDTLAGLIYASDLETLEGNKIVQTELNKLIDRVEWWLNDMNKKLDSTTILEGEIIYGE